MARSAESATIFTGTTVLVRFAHALVSLARAFRDRREVRNLAEFDERMLKDIGLTPNDVVCALAEPLHHRPSWVLVRCVGRPAQSLKPVSDCKPRPVVPLVSRG